MAGDGNERLHPGDTLLREQLAVMLYRYSQLPKVQTTEALTPNEDSTAAAGA